MGLDMYAYAVKSDAFEGAVDFHVNDEAVPTKEWYWRKFSELHTWMERLYREKGGKAVDFNCVNVELTEEDIKRLITDLKNENLDFVGGFFFGVPNVKEHIVEDVLKFAGEALAQIFMGRKVYYSSWW